MKVAKFILIFVGVLLLLYSFAISKPNKMYATLPYGRGIVREVHNEGKWEFCIGLICLAVGYILPKGEE